MTRPWVSAAPLLVLGSCASSVTFPAHSIESERDFLSASGEAVVLQSGTGSLVVTPELQGRVMTSGVRPGDLGLGFVNRAVVAEPPDGEPFTNYGGEDRFWLGPEGGPYALFFDGEAPRELEHWRVPKDLDRGAFDVVSADARRVVMEREVRVENAVGSEFHARVERVVEALTQAEAEELFGALPPGAEWVAFRSRTRVTNAGEGEWRRESGLPCIWILGMFRCGPETRVIAPFRSGPGEAEWGPPLDSSYFGEVPEARLRMGSNFASFAADGAYRSKIGILRSRAMPVLGAWDPLQRVLTVARFGPLDRAAPYVRETWPVDQERPYDGDVANSYNHGGPEPFYELESSSPALELAPGQSQEHWHATLHLRPASDSDLDAFAGAALQVDWSEVRRVSHW